jgi:ribosomal protein S18 acetylase RimI-like enzyme
MLAITSAQPTDRQDLQEHDKRCFPLPEDIFRPHQFRHLLRSPTSLVFVMRRNGRIVASIIGLVRRFRIPSGRIYKVSVASEERGQGLAGCLISFMEERFRALGLRDSCAEVRVSNIGSQTVFTRAGYSPKSTLPRYYPNGEDAMKYWKRL